jgi:hypothetical protein
LQRETSANTILERVYLKKDVAVSNDNWNVAIEIGTKVYEDTVATIRNDLEIINSQHKGWTLIVELKLIEVSVNVLEARFSEFQQLLPTFDKRRGLLNLGGSILNHCSGQRQ